MKFVLSGEGPTDIGKIDYCTRSFDPGPMTLFIDSIVHRTIGSSPLETHRTDENVILFIPKSELVDRNKNEKMVLPSKKASKGFAYFAKNAHTLGRIAKDIAIRTNDFQTVAVLFRDSDPTRSHDDYEAKRDSMNTGFERARFEHGVPMIPRQSMEAWLLDSYDWQGETHRDFENDPGGRHSALPYKTQLMDLIGQSNQHYLVQLVKDGTFDQNRIGVKSFRQFKTRLIEVLSWE
jgi:hypothetical protein